MMKQVQISVEEILMTNSQSKVKSLLREKRKGKDMFGNDRACKSETRYSNFQNFPQSQTLAPRTSDASGRC